ncbi:MAG TPA: FUSC family protein [Thermoanaerobaculia bacterium]|nr:FUSC family protein [Thermoanaerobaculia bacterium]
MQRFRTHITQATQVANARPAYAAGLRAAVATVGPLLAGSALEWPNAAWMGLAGFNVALADKGGALRTRLGAMIPATFYGTLAVIAGALAGRHPLSAVIVIAIWAIGAGIARTYGAPATGTGVLSLATLVISMEQPAPTLLAALTRGRGVLAGAAFAIALSLLLGRFRLYAPARLAIARAYRALAAVARGESSAIAEARAAIAESRRTLTQLRRGLNGESPRGERLLVLLESSDRLATLLEREPAPRPDLAAILLAIADGIERERYSASLNTSSADPLHDPLVTALTALRELNDERDAERPRFDFRAAYIAPVRGVLTWHSAVLRHALRVAVAAGIASAITRALHVDRGYWLTLTVVVVLQPYTSATLQRGLQRIVGTIGGAVVAALLLSVVHTPLQMMAIVFVGAALTVALLPVNYGLFAFVLTPTFVMLAEVHALDRHLVWLRVSNTLFGAMLALLAAFVLWPASERGRLRDDVAAALRALAELARCTVECDDEQIAEARRDFAVALENANASLQRALSDHREGAAEEAAMTVLIYSRRFAAAFTRLAHAAARENDRLRLAALGRYAAAMLTELANAVAHERPPVIREEPPPHAVAEAERILEPLAAVAAAVRRV